jgi:hypothetical protein
METTILAACTAVDREMTTITGSTVEQIFTEMMAEELIAAVAGSQGETGIPGVQGDMEQGSTGHGTETGTETTIELEIGMSMVHMMTHGLAVGATPPIET